MTHQMPLLPQSVARTEDTDRILRMFARFTSVGYAAYLVILWPSITDLAPRMEPWWTPTIVVVVFGCGLLPGALSFQTDTQAMRASAAVAATVFLLAVASWPAAWNGPDLPASDGVWLAAFPGLASLAAVLAWPIPVAFVHLVIGCAGVQAINLVARDGAQVEMLQRQGEDRGDDSTVLRAGDLLLLEGPWDELDAGIKRDGFLVVNDPELVKRQAVPLERRSARAIVTLTVMIALMETGAMAPVMAALLATGAMIVLRILTIEQAYRRIIWTTVLLALLPGSTAASSRSGELRVRCVGSRLV